MLAQQMFLLHVQSKYLYIFEKKKKIMIRGAHVMESQPHEKKISKFHIDVKV